MRSKNRSGFLGRLDRVASGELVSEAEDGLDRKSKKLLEKKLAIYAEKMKKKLARKLSKNHSPELEEDESEPENLDDETDEGAETDNEVNIEDSDHEDHSEKQADEIVQETEVVEEVREQQVSENTWRIINPVDDADVSPPEDLEPPSQEQIEAEERHLAEQEELRKKRGKAKVRETKRTRELATDPDFEAEPELVESGAGPSKKKKKSEEPEFTPGEYFKAFKDSGFLGTFYLHKPTLEQLGIEKDVDDILSTICMERFAGTPYPTYPTLAAEFLSTLAVKDMPGDIGQEQFGGGMITFRAWGKSKTLFFNAIDQFFGFKEGKPVQQNVSKIDQHRVWNLIAGDPKDIATGELPKQLKGAHIRNPAIHYARKVIAETFHSRFDTGTASSCDMSMLTSSLSKLIESDDPMSGDIADAGLTYLLCKHLESFRSKVQAITRRNQQMAKMTIGGTITGLLTLAGIDFSGDEKKVILPRELDGAYLRTHSFLYGPRERTKFYYQFQTPTVSMALVQLPNPSLTILEKQRNFSFLLPSRLLTDPRTVWSSPERALIPRDGSSSQGKPKKKKTAATPSGKGSSSRVCVCTQEGYRERLIAEIEASLQEKFQAQIAELSTTFVRRSELPKTPSQRLGDRSSERPTVGSTSGPADQTRVIDTEEDIADTVTIQERANIIRLKTKKPAPKGP